MRLFIAIDFPDRTKAELTQIINSLQITLPQVSWVKTKNLHLTLKFLGYVKKDKVLQVKEGLEKAASKVTPFQLVFKKMGFFARDELIIWLGIDLNSVLSQLIRNIEKEMGKYGCRKENRKYFPHVTLGRGKRLIRNDIILIKETIGKENYANIPPVLVSAATLMESTLTAKGPVYTPLYKFALGLKRFIIYNT